VNREISPMVVAGIVAGIVAVGLVIFLIRGPLAPRPQTTRSQAAGQKMMESMQRPRVPTRPAYGGGAMGGMPSMPGQPRAMPGQPMPPR
jgi:hypothetical protein